MSAGRRYLPFQECVNSCDSSGVEQPGFRIDQHALRGVVVAALVVLFAEVGELVAERQEEAVRLVVPGAEERPGLGDEAVVLRLVLWRHL
jgi:hypothetical protein